MCSPELVLKKSITNYDINVALVILGLSRDNLSSIHAQLPQTPGLKAHGGDLTQRAIWRLVEGPGWRQHEFMRQYPADRMTVSM